MRFSAYDDGGELLATRDYYSVGGGFVVNQDEAAEDRIVADTTPLPYPFHSGDELLEMCERQRQDDRAADARRTKSPGAAKPKSAPACSTIWQRDAGLRRARHPRRRHAARRPAREAARAGDVRGLSRTPGSGAARSADDPRLGQSLRARGQRGKRRRRPRRHRADQRRRRHRSGRAALLRALLPERERATASSISC